MKDVFPQHPKWPALRDILSGMGAVVTAVSGGVDSLLLATLAHRALPGRALAAHALSPAVPSACTRRVEEQAQAQGWNLRQIVSGEFDDERYLANPFNRCYFCKGHLYDLLADLAARIEPELGVRPQVLSGANTDDLGEHRPGLDAARERGVRHPFVEADVSKADIRAMARSLGLSFADIPASPCLASRIYTGTRVTTEALRAVEQAEEHLKRRLNVSVLRCRVNGRDMLVEMASGEQGLALPEVLDELARSLRATWPALASLTLDPEPYRPGRAFRSDS